jgi:hypothetical protein
MSEEANGKIEINVVNTEDGASVNFSTNMNLADMNYWLDQVKYLIVSGEAELTS